MRNREELSTAEHEAAHALVCLALGIEPEYIALESAGNAQDYALDLIPPDSAGECLVELPKKLQLLLRVCNSSEDPTPYGDLHADYRTLIDNFCVVYAAGLAWGELELHQRGENHDPAVKGGDAWRVCNSLFGKITPPCPPDELLSHYTEKAKIMLNSPGAALKVRTLGLALCCHRRLSLDQIKAILAGCEGELDDAA